MTTPMPIFPYNADGNGDIQAIDFIQWVAAYNQFATEYNAEQQPTNGRHARRLVE